MFGLVHNSKAILYVQSQWIILMLTSYLFLISSRQFVFRCFVYTAMRLLSRSTRISFFPNLYQFILIKSYKDWSTDNWNLVSIMKEMINVRSCIIFYLKSVLIILFRKTIKAPQPNHLTRRIKLHLKILSIYKNSHFKNSMFNLPERLVLISCQLND